MPDPTEDELLKQLYEENQALYDAMIAENLAADAALVGGKFSEHLRIQAKAAREAIGVEDAGDDDELEGEAGE